jgi:methionyl-tRNA formyltransferase
MRIIFMGSAAFAVPSLAALHSAKYDVAMVLSQPDKPAGRGRHMTAPPLASFARNLGLPLYQPKSLKGDDAIGRIRECRPDMIVVVAYGKLLPKEVIDIPPEGCVNVHSSLLPKYRGAAPINWAIVNGEKETGVTTMFINEELDAGDILLKKRMPIGDDDTAITLHNKLAPLGAELLLETIEGLKKKAIRPEHQDGRAATYAPVIKKEDGVIHWEKSAASIRNLIRGMQPWPSAYTHLDGKMLRIFDANVLDAPALSPPGTILAAADSIVVATGSGKLSISELQLEGKNRLRAPDFLNGHKVKEGDVL